MPGTSNLPAVARRFTRALPTIGPRARAWLLAGFLTLHLAAALATVVDMLSRHELVPANWHRLLHPYIEGGPADRYSGVLFSAVAVLAAAQALRPPSHRSGPRWLWVVGWLSMAFFIALIAFDELYGPRAGFMWRGDVTSFLGLPDPVRWVIVAAPFSALPEAAPFAVLPAAAACWALWTGQRGHPARALLVGLVAVISLGSLVQDAFDEMLVNLLLDDWLGYLRGPPRLKLTFEEGAEVMAATALGVVFIEMLAARPRSARDAPVCTRAGSWRLAAFAAAAGLLAISLTISAPPLVRHQLHKGDGWETVAPWAYTGPITLVEQRFRANRDNLSRVDVWAYIDGGPAGQPAEIFARLTPEGADAPIRESRTEAHGALFSNATVTFDFAPIPDSSGRVYTLAVGVLSGPTPYVFLGLTSGDVIPDGAAIVSGAPTRYADDLAMRTVWIGRFIDGQHPGLIGEVILHVFLWVWLVVIAWAGLSGHRPRFWRRFVWPSVGISALVTACIVSIMLAIFALHSPAQLG